MSNTKSDGGSLVALAEQVLENVRKLEASLSASPTFENDTISSMPDDLQPIRKALIDQTEQLNALVRGAEGPLGRVVDNTYNYLDDLALEAIYTFRVPQNVPQEPGSSISFSDLAHKCNVQEGRLTRFIRHAMTKYMFYEPKLGFVAHTVDSRLLATDQALFDVVGSILQDMRPASLKVTEAMRKCIDAGKPELFEAPDKTGFQLAFNTPELFYPYISADQERIRRFSNHLVYWERTDPYTAQQVPIAYPWSNIMPVKDRECSQDSPGLVVDMGGGNGQYSIAIARKHAHLHLIVQDLPGVSAEGPESVPADLKSRVTFQDHDAFTPQTVVADVYFLRHVFHNWPDAQCVKMLQNLIPAMKPGARVLLCDAVIPDNSNADERFVRRWDMLMLSLFNARERSVDDMVALFERADKRFKFNGGVYDHAGAMDRIVEAVWTP